MENPRLRRPAGLVFELPEAIALDQQQPARLQRAPDAFEYAGARGRRQELEEDADDHIVGFGGPRPGLEIGLLVPQRDAALFRQRLRLRKRARREVGRQHVEAEARELFQRGEKGAGEPARNQSAVFSLIGYKGDLLLIHFRNSFAELNQVELELTQSRLNAFLHPSIPIYPSSS